MSADFEITIPKAAPPPVRYSFEIDCRENSVVEWYKKSALAQDDKISVKRLDTSDFIFLRNGVPFICIERKRIDDFASSIRDGRYKTQKLEMIEFAKEISPSPSLVYLVEQFRIENDADMKSIIGKTNITKETVLSAITKTMFRDGFQVVFSIDVEDSIRWLTKMWSNLCKGEFKGYDTDESTNHYFNSVSLKYAKRTTSQMKDIDRNKANSWWMLALANINGISAGKAQEIVKRYPTVESLLQAYKKCSTQSEKAALLGNLKVNTRRIGDVSSKNVYEHITGDVVKSSEPVTKNTTTKPKPKPKFTKPKSKSTTQKPKPALKPKPKPKPYHPPQIDFSVCMLDSDSE